MDLMHLRTLLDSDASTAQMTLEDAAAWCNARVMPAPVPVQDVTQFLVATGLFADIVLASREVVAADASNKPRVKAALDMVTALEHLPTFNLTIPAYLARVSAALDALIGLGFMAAGHKAAILALGDNKLTRAEAAGLEPATPRHIIEARAL